MKYLFTVLFFAIPFIAMTQTINSELATSINEDGSEPDSSAILDIQSSSKGVLFPRMKYDDIQNITEPAEGLMVYDAEFKCLRMYNGSSWECLYESKNSNDAQGNITARSGGGTSNDRGYGIAIDPIDSSVVVTGIFFGDFTLGDSTFSSEGSSDIFIAKYNKTLELQWVLSEGGANTDYAYDIGIDDLGLIYITGYFRDATTFGDSTLTSGGGTDIYLAKYNSSGEFQWIAHAGGTYSADRAESLAIDNLGEIYITGSFGDTTYFDSSTSIIATGTRNIFLAKYGKGGNLKWAKSGGSTNTDYSYSVTVDPSNLPIICGAYRDTATFGIHSIISNGYQDVFVVKYSPTGIVQWAQSGGGSSSDYGHTIVADSSDNIYITGYFQDTAIFDSNTLISEGDGDIFLTKYDKDGNVLDAISVGSSEWDKAYGMAMDAEENIYVTGYSSGILELEGVEYKGIAKDDFLIIKFNSDLEGQWAQIMGGKEDDEGRDLIIAKDKSLYFTGSFRETATFDTSTLVSKGTDDFIIGKYIE